MDGRAINLQELMAEPWSPGFLREMDLTIAQNLAASQDGGFPLATRDLDARVSEFCSPFDRGLQRQNLGVVDIPQAEPGVPEYLRAAYALRLLRGRPRGAWAVFHLDGAYDAYMSDGYGGVATGPGEKFTHRTPAHPDFVFERLYGETMSLIVQDRAEEILAQVQEVTFAGHTVAEGATLRGVWVGGCKWSRMQYVGLAGERCKDASDKPLVKAVRPGIKEMHYVLEKGAFNTLFSVPVRLPASLEDPTGPSRLRTFAERRAAAAQAAWQGEVANVGHHRLRAEQNGDWEVSGDRMTRPIWLLSDRPEMPSGLFRVAFRPGSTQPMDVRLAWNDELEMATGPRM